MSLALKLMLSPLLVAQAVATRRRAPELPEAAGARSGVAGAGEAFGLLIVGDSSAAGVGVRTQDEALAGHLTRRLAASAKREVHWQLLARSGITTAQALELVQHERPRPADVAVAVLGVNDVIEQVPTERAVAQRAALADWLLAQVEVHHVVFAPLPPMHRSRSCRNRCAGSRAATHAGTTTRWHAGPRRAAMFRMCRSRSSSARR